MDADGLFGVPAEELGCVTNLALGIGEGLAVFERDQFGELVGMVDQDLLARAKDLGASTGGHLGPFDLGSRGRVDRSARVGGSSVSDGGDDVTVGGVGHIDSVATCTVDPRATNQQLFFHFLCPYSRPVRDPR